MSEKETYLGDGLYASFDGYNIILRAPRAHGDDVVYLEPLILRAFDEWRNALADRMQKRLEAEPK